MKKIVIFGSTGSIGQQTLEVLRHFPQDFEVVGLTAHKNADLLDKQKKEFHCDGDLGLERKDEFIEKADYVLNGVPGFAGLEVSLACIRQGKTLLSANKESLAVAGKWLCEEAKQSGAQIFPLDSEASAIWQLLHDYGREKVSSITLTCSGGPFYGKKTKELQNVTVEEALKHPTWKMGPKVSVDSASLINKVLEVYEIHNLFDIPLKDIHIVIHPESLVHSMLHTKTGATKMHIQQNDMRLFISYALHYPTQPESPWPILRARKSGLNFAKPDSETFRCLKWLHQHKGNPNFPIVLNALNDLAVERFLAGQLSFLGIYDFIEAGFEKWLWELPPATLSDMIEFTERVNAFYYHERRHSTSRGKISASRPRQAVV